MARREVKVQLTAEDQLTGKLNSLQNMLGAITALDVGEKIAQWSEQLVEFIGHQIEMAEGMGKLSEKTGIGTGALSVYALAARETNTDQEALSNGLVKLARNQQEATDGSAKQRKAFADLGITLNDLKTMSPDQLFQLVATKLAGVESPALKAQIAINLFGKAGANLIPVMNQLAGDGFGALEEKARRLGVYFGADFVEQAKRTQENLADLQAAGQGMAMQFVQGLLPAVNGVASALMGLEGSGNGFRGFGQAVGDQILQLAHDFAFLTQFIAKAGAEYMSMEGHFNHAVYSTNIAVGQSGRDSKNKHLADSQQEIDAGSNLYERANRDYDNFVNTLGRAQKELYAPPSAAGSTGKPLPVTGGTGSGLSEGEAKAEQNARAAMQEAAIKSQQEIAAARLKIVTDAAKNEQEVEAAKNDTLYAQAGESLQQYLMRKDQLLKEANAKEVTDALQAIFAQEAASKKAIAEQQALVAKSKAGADRDNATAKISGMQGAAEKEHADLVIRFQDLKAKGAAADDKNATEQFNATRAYYEYRAEKEAALQQQIDHGAEVAIANINKEYDAAVEARKKTDGPNANTSDLTQQRDYSIAGAQAGNIQEKIDLQVNAYSQLARVLDNQVAQGQITTLQREQALNAARTQAAQNMAALVKQYQLYADASNDPKLQQHAADLKQQTVEMGQMLDPKRVQLAGDLNKSFDSFFTTMASSSQNGMKSFTAFADSIVADINRMILKAFEMRTIEPMINKLLGLAGSVVGGAASGGGLSSGSSQTAVYADGAGPTTALAGGGSFSANSPLLVGERGPELMIPDHAGAVVNNDGIKKLGIGGGSERPVTVNVHTSTSQPAQVQQSSRVSPDDIVLDVMVRDKQSNGPISQMFKS